MTVQEEQMGKYRFEIGFNERKNWEGKWRSSGITCEVSLEDVDEAVRSEIAEAVNVFKNHLAWIVAEKYM